MFPNITTIRIIVYKSGYFNKNTAENDNNSILHNSCKG